jgi:hypothetical protein
LGARAVTAFGRGLRSVARAGHRRARAALPRGPRRTGRATAGAPQRARGPGSNRPAAGAGPCPRSGRGRRPEGRDRTSRDLEPRLATHDRTG